MTRIIRDDSFDLVYELSSPAMRHFLAFFGGVLFGICAYMAWTNWSPVYLPLIFLVVWRFLVLAGMYASILVQLLQYARGNR